MRLATIFALMILMSCTEDPREIYLKQRGCQEIQLGPRSETPDGWYETGFYATCGAKRLRGTIEQAVDGSVSDAKYGIDGQ
jgi:hypothetical protein